MRWIVMIAGLLGMGVSRGEAEPVCLIGGETSYDRVYGDAATQKIAGDNYEREFGVDRAECSPVIPRTLPGLEASRQPSSVIEAGAVKLETGSVSKPDAALPEVKGR